MFGTKPPGDDRNYYQETLARMEPEIAAVDLTAAAASIAISLQRIADGLAMINQRLVEIEAHLETRSDDDGLPPY